MFGHLREVPNQVAALSIGFAQDVEYERFHIEVKRFVIKKQLCEKTQVLTVNLKTKSKETLYSL